MKLPLTRYGLKEIILIPVVLGAWALLACFFWPVASPWPQLGALLMTLAGWAFFRDFERKIPSEPNILLAPADGRVTDCIEVTEDEFLKSRALRIGIFLSVFDVHVNRSPCAGEVSYLQEHPGKCLNAMRVQAASQFNRAHCLGLNCPEHPARQVMVKQITGAIARRIVCASQVGGKLRAGERFGIIKFGSRTELYLPLDDHADVVVKKGQIVRAGTTVLVRYRPPAEKTNI